MTLETKIAQLRREILEAASRHGATNVRVFGSVARRAERQGSDLDLLVDVGANPSPFFPGGLIEDLEELLGCHVDVVTQGALHWYIRERILQEARPL
jgi:uncharacterized protein